MAGTVLFIFKISYFLLLCFNRARRDGFSFSSSDCFSAGAPWGWIKVTNSFLSELLLVWGSIACYGYRVVEKDHPGELQVVKLREMHIPSGPIYGQLKAGKTVTLDDGRALDGHDFIGTPQKGRIVAILGDTRKTANAVTLARDADVLVHESTFAKGEDKMAKNYYHSTSLQAAEIAKKAGAKRLLLNHISARYTGKAAYQLAYQVRDVFPNTRVVNDFDIIDIPFNK